MTAAPLTVHVVFEYGPDGLPFGSSHVRLLRPLSHPRTADRVRVSFGAGYGGDPVDVVVIDRLWCPDASPDKVARLVDVAHRDGACVVHALDDDFPGLFAEQPDWGSAEQRDALAMLLALADGLLVTTDALAERYGPYCANVAVVPNALDERLLAVGRRTREVRRFARDLRRRFGRDRSPVVVGYMGTYTHDDDLAMIAPALHAVHARCGDGVRFEVLAAVARGDTWSALAGLPLAALHPTPAQAVYPAFLPWFCNTFAWDIALAPLRDTPFTRAKSDIKHLDYAALGAAGVYSRHPAYTSSVRDEATGLLVSDDPEDWAAAIVGLVGDDLRRRRIATAARRYLLAERTLARTAERWAEALAKLAANCRRGR